MAEIRVIPLHSVIHNGRCARTVHSCVVRAVVAPYRCGTVFRMTAPEGQLVLTRSQAIDIGIARSRVFEEAYARVARGRYVPTGVEVDMDGWIAVVAAGLPPGTTIGGWAAARLLEARARPRGDELVVFDGVLPAMDAAERVRLPILVAAPREARLKVPPVAQVWRSDLADSEVIDLDRVPVTAPVRTAFDLARLWPLVPAVVALDRLVRLGLVEVDDVTRLLAERAGYRGVRGARQALGLVDGGSESPRESMLRLVWMDAGLPRPRANRVVCGPDGSFVARVDLVDEAAGVIGEYDGDVHADATRRRADAARQEALEDLGLVVVRAVGPDLASATGRRAWQHRLRLGYARARQRRGGAAWVITDA